MSDVPAPWAGAEPVRMQDPLPIPAPRQGGEVVDLATLDNEQLAKLWSNLRFVEAELAAARRLIEDHVLGIMERENTGTMYAGRFKMTRRRPSARNDVDRDQLYQNVQALVADGLLSADAARAAVREDRTIAYTWGEVKKLLAHPNPDVAAAVSECVTVIPPSGDPTVSIDIA